MRGHWHARNKPINLFYERNNTSRIGTHQIRNERLGNRSFLLYERNLEKVEQRAANLAEGTGHGKHCHREQITTFTLNKNTIMDFDTMRANCIAIHQTCYEIGLVTEQLGLPLLTIHKDKLATHEKTKSWDGMGRYAKELYDNVELWDQLPESASIMAVNTRKMWYKEDAKDDLLDAFNKLGGKKLYRTQ